jgi:hypothetical protein
MSMRRLLVQKKFKPLDVQTVTLIPWRVVFLHSMKDWMINNKYKNF